MNYEYVRTFTIFTNSTDINECRESSPCDHNCTNTDGSYTCSCNPGYSLIGRISCVGRFKSQVFLLRYSYLATVEGKSIGHTSFQLMPCNIFIISDCSLNVPNAFFMNECKLLLVNETLAK